MKLSTRSGLFPVTLACAAALLVPACKTSHGEAEAPKGAAKSATSAEAAPTATPMKDAAKDASHAVADPSRPPKVSDMKAVDVPGAHNVVAYHDGFYSGSVPEGPEGFASLAKMGIKTIISVDGSEPEVERARALGMKYVHLPIGYNGFDETRERELARATQEAMKSGPVYMHCHHGKHRSAGAAGTVAVNLGWLKPDEATARMKVSGTAPNYSGLYACAADAKPIDPAVLAAIPADFPEVTRAVGLVKSMVAIDEVQEDLKSAEKAGWKAPPSHPDLVPAAAAGQMADHFRRLLDLDEVKAKPADFVALLKKNGEQYAAMEEAMLAGGDAKKVSEQFKAATATCKDCHTKYRD